MKAVSFNVSPARYVLARTAGRVLDSVIYGRLSPVKLRDLELPPLPGPRWVRVDVLRAGICGTDLSTITFSASPAMEPFGSFPAVLGHEILGRVSEVGAAVTSVEPGQRVVVDPMISCEMRGREAPDWCRSCRMGSHRTCEWAGESGPLELGDRPLARGLTIGYHHSLPGGWGERMLTHEAHVFPVDEALDDRTAVLTEPLSIAMHAVLGAPPREGEPVLVIGSGAIALGTVWALRATGFTGEVLAQTKRPHEAKLARRLGASDVVEPGDAARDALVATGAQAYMPIIGPEVYAGGGFPLVFDCVGTADSLGQALRFAATRGRVVVTGHSASAPRLDLSFLWARELELIGYIGSGAERFRGEARHTFEVTLELLRESGAPLSDVVTHVFPLLQYRDALAAAMHRRRSGAVKVVLDPTAR